MLLDLTLGLRILKQSPVIPAETQNNLTDQANPAQATLHRKLPPRLLLLPVLKKQRGKCKHSQQFL